MGYKEEWEILVKRVVSQLTLISVGSASEVTQLVRAVPK